MNNLSSFSDAVLSSVEPERYRRPGVSGSGMNPDYVAWFFTKRGYTLLDRYENAKQKLRYTCSSGHNHSITWSDFQHGYGCPMCAGQIVAHEQVAKVFEAKGYKLLDEYKNSRQKLRYICPNGHKHDISWANFSNGKGCPYCAQQVVTQLQIKTAFKSRGCKLLDKYEKTHKKMRYICPKGHTHAISWTHFQKGHGCAYCSGRIVTSEQVEDAFFTRGYKLLDKYEKTHKKMRYICPKGHTHKVTWHSFQRGAGCPYCAGQIVAPEQVEDAFSKRGYTLLDRYENAKQKLRYTCSSGHNHSITWSDFQHGYGCPMCANYGFNSSLPALLYYLRFETRVGYLYKIGITNRTVEQRYRRESTPYKILMETYYLFGYLAKEKEVDTLSRFEEFRYKGPYTLRDGNTELFAEDVLKLDR